MNPFKPISISLIPNYSLGDVVLALRLLLQPWRYLDAEWKKQLHDNLRSYLDRRYVFLFESGRAAEYFLLRALGVGPGDEVIIQAFTCLAVPAAIIWTGAKPIFVDIDRTLNLNAAELEEAITSRTKAVIVQHTLGYPADLEKIGKICGQRGLVLIEDCAHGLGNVYKRKKLGNQTLASFFSFGRDKVVSSIWGGAVSTDNEDMAKRLEELSLILPEHKHWWVAKQLLYPALIYLILNLYTFLYLGKILHSMLHQLGVLSRVLTSEEKSIKKPTVFYREMPGALAILAAKQLQKLPEFIRRRRCLAKFYSESLGEDYFPEHSYLRYSTLVADPEKLRLFTASSNVFLGDWYDSVVAPKGVDLEKVGYQPGYCPVAERMCRQIVNLPTNPNLSLAEAGEVVTMMKLWKSKK